MKLGGSYVDEDSFGDRIGCLYHFADFEICEKNGPKIEGTVRTIHGILQGQSRLNALYQREHDKRLSLCYTAFIT